MGSIVWLASYPRSGNTWTRSFLHSLLAALQGRPAAQDINDMGALTTWDVYPIWWRDLLAKPLAETGAAEAAALRPRAQARIAAEARGVVFVKTHNALVLSHGHPTINFKVTSGAVYIVRNPLDVAVSLAHHFAIDQDAAIQRLNDPGYAIDNHEGGAGEIYGAWRENVLSWTRRPSRTLFVMRYEDMLDRPRETFARLARHLLLEPTEAQLEAAIAASSFERLAGQESAAGFREKPRQSASFFRAGRAGQWQEVLTPRQVEAVVTANREQMERFGYLVAGEPVRTGTPA